MKKPKKIIGVLFGMVLSGCIIGLSACRDSDTDSVITITPESSELEGPEAVVLTAVLPARTEGMATNQSDRLFMPLAWSVNNPELGRVSASGSHQAVYVGSGRKGQNVVFVKDQSGREGVAAINQR